MLLCRVNGPLGTAACRRSTLATETKLEVGLGVTVSCKRAFRYRRLKEIYYSYRNNVGGGSRCDSTFRLLYRVNGPLCTAS